MRYIRSIPTSYRGRRTTDCWKILQAAVTLGVNHLLLT
jgi:hypothetical protein